MYEYVDIIHTFIDREIECLEILLYSIDLAAASLCLCLRSPGWLTVAINNTSLENSHNQHFFFLHLTLLNYLKSLFFSLLLLLFFFHSLSLSLFLFSILSLSLSLCIPLSLSVSLMGARKQFFPLSFELNMHMHLHRYMLLYAPNNPIIVYFLRFPLNFCYNNGF